MKTKVTLTRVFKKEVVIEVNKDLLKGMNEEQIHDFLIEEYDFGNENELFESAELVEISYIGEVDTDRFDIEDDNGKVVYGGHL